VLQERLDQILPQAQDAESAAQPANDEAPAVPVDPSLLAAYERTLTEIYDFVNPICSQYPRRRQPASHAWRSGNFLTSPISPACQILPNDGSLPFSQGLGSGFVWDEQGHIVTNNHVIKDAEKIEVTFHDGTVAEAELVGADPDSDLAVLKNRSA